jgi:hypothetical protein
VVSTVHWSQSCQQVTVVSTVHWSQSSRQVTVVSAVHWSQSCQQVTVVFATHKNGFKGGTTDLQAQSKFNYTFVYKEPLKLLLIEAPLAFLSLRDFLMAKETDRDSELSASKNPPFKR